LEKIYSVTLIGLGNIGLLYDYESDNKTFLTHLKSFFFSSSFNVVNCIDKSEEKINLAKKKYGNKINYFHYFTENAPITDVYVLCSLPKVNKKLYSEISKINKDAFFLIEKPAWFLRKVPKNCFINYFRKTIPAFKKLKNRFKSNYFGSIQSINCYYTKGLRNNGSHLIDLIFYFFGNSLDKNSFKVINSFSDYDKVDKTVSFTYRHQFNENFFPVTFSALSEKMYSIIEIDIFTQHHRIKIQDFGRKIDYFSIDDDPIFVGYKLLKKIKTTYVNLNSSGEYVIKEISNILNKKISNHSDFQNENNIIEFINMVKKND
tara:strand:- start:131 stop:1084 length:954 start_codon:yes stop_codon:yes gene_type:complete